MLGDDPYSAAAAKGNRRMAIFVGSMAVGALGLWLPNGALWSFESQTAQAATNCAGGGSSIASALAAPTPCTSEAALNAGKPNWQLAAFTAVEPQESLKRLDLRTSLKSDIATGSRLPPRERFAASVGALRSKPEQEPVASLAVEGPSPEPAELDEVDLNERAIVDTIKDNDEDDRDDHDDGGEHGGEHGDDVADSDDHGGEHGGEGDRDCDSGGERSGGEGGEGGERGRRGGHG